MVIFIKSDYSELDSELDRLENLGSSEKMKFYLDEVLEIGFKKTQANVHIDTSSLKSSGKKKSKYTKTTKTWTGEIRYGGPSLGINNPVTYAIYEKARGGDHDFFNGLSALHPLFVKAILKGLSK